MGPIRIFVSSVQREFAVERKALAEYIRTDALLGRFFEVFIFELESSITYGLPDLIEAVTVIFLPLIFRGIWQVDSLESVEEFPFH